MVLFASAGTDAMVKQVVKDSLGIAISIMPSARKALTEHVAKRILRKTTVGESVDAIFLSEVLINENRTDALIQQLIKHLIAGSLQSTPELLKVAAVFSIKPKDLLSDVSKLDDAFTARNYIAHEMDVDFTQPNRSRRARKRDDMVFMANTLLNVDESFLRAVDSKFTS
jgi:hypothetical protein